MRNSTGPRLWTSGLGPKAPPPIAHDAQPFTSFPFCMAGAFGKPLLRKSMLLPTVSTRVDVDTSSVEVAASSDAMRERSLVDAANCLLSCSVTWSEYVVAELLASDLRSVDAARSPKCRPSRTRDVHTATFSFTT